MTEDHRCRLIFEEFLDKTEDGFIVVDQDGIITDINQNYCDFLAKDRKNLLGKPIGSVITTTSMYDVLAKRHRGDGSQGVYIQPYCAGETRDATEAYAVANRFCIFDEDGQLIGAAAHMKFRQRAMDTAKEIAELELKYYKEAYQNNISGFGGFQGLIGKDPKLLELKRLGIQAAKTDFPVLITGETGTGKEVFAKAIHLESERRDGPFIAINCGAIPDNLLESELFGYEEGAFTGAKRGGKPGKFQLANGGTLFLDEIGDMPFPLQVKLLRVLQDAQVERVGGESPIHVDVRIVAATRQDLQTMMKAGTFREDLYYRLAVINIEMIPLRDRPMDILLHANCYLSELNRKYRTSIILSDRVKKCLRAYSWPGNVRELQNVLAGAYASCDKVIIDLENLPIKVSSPSRGTGMEPELQGGRLSDAVSAYEAKMIRNSLQRNGQNVRAAAEELGIERSFLYRKMKRLNIGIQRVLKPGD
ncbi:sigma 54-interacting transcriptional regulator [Candidatus Pseudoscillospira sp. SGI.172]|uniref:sigma-54 interaction domain-containing protein n=1 Tax=Candidatus Pseudoscillospira sp. SGI.172 TaxID=3420582 RepID=UPI0009BBC0A6